MKAQKYMVECQQVGQNVWKKVWDGSADRLYFKDRNVAQVFPGQPAPSKVVQKLYKPGMDSTRERQGARLLGYQLEKCKKDINQWGTLNPVSEPIQVKSYFKDPVDFMIARAGNSIRIKVNYEGAPQPDITWLKNEEPVSSWVNIINVENMSTLVIPSSQYPDSGVYTIMAKNSSGHNSFDIEVRVQMNQSAHQALWSWSRWFMVK
ncbi:twitchin-like [Misgurnus anguillicaudatus]|uniref:twitchin-like n=1 Tax=Misgurnus anguillicaudatus TaxID=75329 RepID=UPI003CCF5320